MREAKNAGGLVARRGFATKCMAPFRRNPKGTGTLGRHSALPSSERHPVSPSSGALIGASRDPFALVDIV
jgi:hypothetical protein